MTRSPVDDGARIFTGIARDYNAAAAALSLAQDARWRRALVAAIDAAPGDLVLDVATGTGLVARELRHRYGCRVVGVDRSADMLAHAPRDAFGGLVLGRAESLPFPDASFDHVTFTYLLRYVDDPRATLRELARVLKPGGRLAALEFGVPANPAWRALWRLYTRIGLPLTGRLYSRRWSEVGAFLGPSIESFYRRHPQDEIERAWHDAGLVAVETRAMSLGGGVVMHGTKPPPRAAPRLGVAFYALRPGGWRDYWTLLHPPYTAWHLSYVLFGAALAAHPDPRVVAGALAAFGLAVGIAAHAFDELAGRPLRTRIPSPILVVLGALALVAAVGIGVVGATVVGWPLLGFVAAGLLLVVLYAFDVPLVHSDAGFALGWGAFPVLTTAYATGAAALPALVGALGAALLSLAQRRLSTRVRTVRRRATLVSGEIRYADGTTEPLDARSLLAAPEAALRILWLAAVAVAAGSLLARWS